MNFTNKEKHYNTLSNYYKYKYNTKVAKISLNANMGCPNRDGNKGYGGCSFCSESGSGDFAGDAKNSLKLQYEEIKEKIIKKWPYSKFIPYLQAFSNTYAKVSYLENLYTSILDLDKDIVGLAIATRPDCITKEIAQLLSKMNKRIPIQLELGLQTINEETALRINRGYPLATFIEAIALLENTGVEIVVHIINGLPNETKQDMLNNILFLNQYPIHGIKIHSLLLLKNTKMALEYAQKPFDILSLSEYVDIVCDQIGYLNSSIIVHRIAADGALEDLIEPKWTIKKLVVQNEIDKELRRRNLYQGDYLKSSSSIE